VYISLGGIYVSIEMILQGIAVVLLIAAQCVQWAIQDVCSVTWLLRGMVSASVAVRALVLAAGTFMNDLESRDMALVLILPLLYTSVPIYQDSSEDVSLWKATIAIQYIAAIVYVIGIVLSARHKISLLANGIANTNMVVQVICFAFAMAGAICIYASGPPGYSGKVQNYQISFAWVIPLLQIACHFTNLQILHLMSLIYSFVVSPTYGDAVIGQLTSGGGYITAGYIFSVFVVMTSSAVSTFLSNPFGLRPIDEYFDRVRDPASFKIFAVSAVWMWLAATNFSSMATSVPFLGLYLAAAVLWLGHESKAPDDHRVLMFVLIQYLLAIVWPLSSSSSFTDFIIFFTVAWFLFYYAEAYQSSPLKSLAAREMEEYETSEPFRPTPAPQLPQASAANLSSNSKKSFPTEQTSLLSHRSDSPEAPAVEEEKAP
jgi:hypothetical protein